MGKTEVQVGKEKERKKRKNCISTQNSIKDTQH